MYFFNFFTFCTFSFLHFSFFHFLHFVHFCYIFCILFIFSIFLHFCIFVIFFIVSLFLHPNEDGPSAQDRGSRDVERGVVLFGPASVVARPCGPELAANFTSRWASCLGGPGLETSLLDSTARGQGGRSVGSIAKRQDIGRLELSQYNCHIPQRVAPQGNTAPLFQPCRAHATVFMRRAQTWFDCDLQGRKINVTNSKTLVGCCRDRPWRSFWLPRM